jgi:topoisomerase-4 subunit A
LSVDLTEAEEIIALFAHREGVDRLIVSSNGYGFRVSETKLLSQKRGGKAVLNLDSGAKLHACPVIASGHDQVAVVGENRRLLFFPLLELPEMARGKGVKLQSYKEGGVLDVGTFSATEGFAWLDSGGRARALPEWREWLGRRASTGRSVPRGWPKSGCFSPDT